MARTGNARLRSQVNHVYVHAQAGIVCQVIAGIVGIRIEDDIVAVPQPTIDVGDIGGSDREVKSVEPETIRAAACQSPDLMRAQVAGKVSVLPGTIEVITDVIAAGIVANPLIVVSVDVGRGWMSGMVNGDRALRRRRFRRGMRSGRRPV